MTQTAKYAATYTAIPAPGHERGFASAPIVINFSYDGTRQGLIDVISRAVPALMQDWYEVPGCMGKLLLNDSIRVTNRLGEHVISLNYLTRLDY